MLTIVNHCAMADAASLLASQLQALGFPARLDNDGSVQGANGANGDDITIEVVDRLQTNCDTRQVVAEHEAASLLEQALRHIPCDFDALPLLVEGDSKIVRLWTPHVVVERFKPTVYSYTHNRYGEVQGTEVLRTRFAAQLFRHMNRLRADTPHVPRGAFLALIEDHAGPLLVQRRVQDCNLEVRVKRYHIGSPLHRYRFTDRHATTQRCGPLTRWSRFDTPVVCFDWRHPLTDEDGHRLADEPISDDYAAVWMDNVPHAKEMARQAFLWLEALFSAAGLILVDLCFFIDRTGHIIYGEISPDCMRVRHKRSDAELENAEALDKDTWRRGDSAADVVAKYQELFERLFGNGTRAAWHRIHGSHETAGNGRHQHHIEP